MFVDWLKASAGRRSGSRALFLAALASAASSFGAEAKGPGQTYCFNKTCHRVKTIAETQALIGRDMKIVASHYDSCTKDRFNPCGLTSSGERFAPERADNAASPILPDGTIAMVWSKYSKEALVVRINNAGPYWGNRKLDLSRAAARKLGIGGVGEVTLRVLKAPTPAEARYSRNRRYEPVPGPIGQFASLDEAHGAMTSMVARGQPGTTALAGLAAPASIDPAVNLASAYAAPVVPGFSIPKGALAQALIAQTAIEDKVVTAEIPPSTNVAAVAPKIAAAKPAPPRRTRVRVTEVKPKQPDASGAMATIVTLLIEPPKSQKPVKRARVATVKGDVARRSESKRKVAARAAPSRVAKRVQPEEYQAGFTTYAEEHYRKPVKVASAAVLQAKRQAGVKPKGEDAAQKAAPKTVKQANAAKAKRQAALKKAGGWQSSAVFELPLAPPSVTLPHPRIPAGEMKDDAERERGPRLRVSPSALV